MMNKLPNSYFNMNILLDRLSKNDQTLAAKLRDRTGTVVSEAAIYKWRKRNSIPCQHVFNVLLAIQNDKPEQRLDFRKFGA